MLPLNIYLLFQQTARFSYIFFFASLINNNINQINAFIVKKVFREKCFFTCLNTYKHALRRSSQLIIFYLLIIFAVIRIKSNKVTFRDQIFYSKSFSVSKMLSTVLEYRKLPKLYQIIGKIFGLLRLSVVMKIIIKSFLVAFCLS